MYINNRGGGLPLQLNLQLFATKVNNPYNTNLNKNYTLSYNDEFKLVDLSYYAKKNISNYDTITTIPDTNMKYLNSGLVAGDMSSMFDNCHNLTTIGNIFSESNSGSIDTNNVINMSYMFNYCTALITLDLSNMNTSKVIDMSNMFYGCYRLATLGLSNFDTSNVINMSYMFYLCSSSTTLTTLDLSNWNTSNVTNMNSMFYYTTLTTLDLSNWNTSNVEDMSYMFNECRLLTTIKGIIDMKSCTDYYGMFINCTKLIGVQIKNPPYGFDGAGLTSSQYTIVS